MAKKQTSFEIDGFKLDELDEYTQFAKPVFNVYRKHRGRKANPQSAIVLCRKFKPQMEAARRQYDQEELTDAMVAFLEDEYWADNKWPLLAFFKQLSKFVNRAQVQASDNETLPDDAERALRRRKLALREKIQELRGHGCDILMLSELEERVKTGDGTELDGAERDIMACTPLS